MNNVIFLDENAVDVFVGEGRSVDVDDAETEGLVLSLLSSENLKDVRAILRVISEHREAVGSRMFKVHPIAEVDHIGAWPGPGRVSDAAYLDKRMGSRAAHIDTKELIEDSQYTFAAPPSSDRYMRRSTDARAIRNYRPQFRLNRNDPAKIVGAAFRSRRPNALHIFDIDTYVKSIKALKVGEEVSLYEMSASKPFMTARVKSIVDNDISFHDFDRTISLADPFKTTLSLNTAVHAPIDILLGDFNVAWDRVVAWATPSPVRAATILALEESMSMQGILDRAGWPNDGRFLVDDWSSLAKRMVFEKTLRNKPAHHEVSIMKPNVDEYNSIYLRGKRTTFVDAWTSVCQIDTGFLALAAASVLAPRSDPRIYMREFSVLPSSHRQTPLAVLHRYVSDAETDKAIQKCDTASFTDFAGLSGVVARLQCAQNRYIEAPIMEYAGLRVPKLEFIIKLRNDIRGDIESNTTHRGESIAAISTRVRSFVASLKDIRSENYVHDSRGIVVVYEEDEEDIYRLSAMDVPHYHANEVAKADVKHDSWDYGNLLNLLCVTGSLNLPETTKRFMVNNAIFVNPVELYMKKLRQAIHNVKVKRQNNLIDWKGGIKSYQIQEDRIVAKMRSDTLGVFCARTMACFAALLSLSPSFDFEYTCHSKSNSKIVCLIMDIMVYLVLPCDEAVLVKMISKFTGDFTAAGKSLDIPDAITEKSKSKSLKWVGFKPHALRLRPVLEEIERVVSANSLSTNIHEVKKSKKLHQRCCQADIRTFVNYFVQEDDVRVAMEKEQNAGDFAMRSWATAIGPHALERTRVDERRVSNVPWNVKGTPLVTPIQDISTVNDGINKFMELNPSLKIIELTAARTAITRACESVSRPTDLARILIPHTDANLLVRFRVAARYVTSASTILSLSKIRFIPIRGIHKLSPGHSQFKLVMSSIVSILQDNTSIAAKLLDDLRIRLDFNMVDEDDLRRSIQNDREDEKVNKMKVAANMTDDQREIFQEYRKFKKIGWEELQQHMATPVAKPPRQEDEVLDKKTDVFAVIDKDGLGGFDRDGDGIGDDVNYGGDEE